MEILDKDTRYIELFLDGKEYYALLRPEGMLAKLLEENPAMSEQVEVARHYHGVILRIPISFSHVIIGSVGGMIVDDVLRSVLARWAHSAPPDPENPVEIAELSTPPGGA